MTTSVFVYGTLMPGQSRWPLLQPYVASVPIPDTVSGVLLDTARGYPALVHVGEGQDVHGWRIELLPDALEEALIVLDSIEGTAQGLYRRTAVTTRIGHACWTYKYLHSTEGLTDLDGRWSVDPELGLEVRQ